MEKRMGESHLYYRVGSDVHPPLLQFLLFRHLGTMSAVQRLLEGSISSLPATIPQPPVLSPLANHTHTIWILLFFCRLIISSMFRSTNPLTNPCSSRYTT